MVSRSAPPPELGASDPIAYDSGRFPVHATASKVNTVTSAASSQREISSDPGTGGVHVAMVMEATSPRHDELTGKRIGVQQKVYIQGYGGRDGCDGGYNRESIKAKAICATLPNIDKGKRIENTEPEKLSMFQVYER